MHRRAWTASRLVTLKSDDMRRRFAHRRWFPEEGLRFSAGGLIFCTLDVPFVRLHG